MFEYNVNVSPHGAQGLLIQQCIDKYNLDLGYSSKHEMCRRFRDEKDYRRDILGFADAFDRFEGNDHLKHEVYRLIERELCGSDTVHHGDTEVSSDGVYGVFLFFCTFFRIHSHRKSNSLYTIKRQRVHRQF